LGPKISALCSGRFRQRPEVAERLSAPILTIYHIFTVDVLTIVPFGLAEVSPPPPADQERKGGVRWSVCCVKHAHSSNIAFFCTSIILKCVVYFNLSIALI